MIERSIKRQSCARSSSTTSSATRPRKVAPSEHLVQELQGRAIEVVEATSAEDGLTVIVSDSAIHAILIDWTLGDDKDHTRALDLPQDSCARATTRSRSS